MSKWDKEQVIKILGVIWITVWIHEKHIGSDPDCALRVLITYAADHVSVVVTAAVNMPFKARLIFISFIRASDVNSPVDVNSPLFGFCQFYSTNMENMS